jgi:methylthioribose-1-phosphate isomerase
MIVNGNHYHTIWMQNETVFMIDQNLLPFEFKILESNAYKDTCKAIKNMNVRGAGAIGSAAGFALAQAFLEAPKATFWFYINQAKADIEATRPTARNLFYATNRIMQASQMTNNPKMAAVIESQKIADEDVAACRKIGVFGNELIKENYRILTHCNAGWLAFTDHGSALSPIYAAHRSNKKVFVYTDETRPRNQGAKLTAWEFHNENIPHKIIPDNAAAFLMQQGKIDMVITGADRIAANGDVANKIGTLEKAICAREFGIPFYVAAPSSTFDQECKTGKDIIIEERDQDEVKYIAGVDTAGELHNICICNPESEALNLAFDVTPAKYISGFITESGIKISS